jgi:hypothetical protein
MKSIKKLLVILLLVSFPFGIVAQTNEHYYKAVATEMYVRNNSNTEWQLYQKNGSTNITIVLEEEFISVQAQKPTIYRIFKNKIEEIDTDNLIGNRYFGRDLKTDEYCTIDVVKSRTSETYLISIIKTNINLRYFIDRN